MHGCRLLNHTGRMKMISKLKFSRAMKEYFKKEIEQGRTEIDILKCNADLLKLLDEQPEVRCDLCEDDGK